MTEKLSIGDKVKFFDKVFFRDRVGIVKRIDGDRALVVVENRFTKVWMKFDKLTREAKDEN